MGECFQLFNFTKRERVGLTHIDAHKADEIAWNPAAGAIVAWYLLQNRGDFISFVGDYDIEDKKAWRFPVPPHEIYKLPDRTADVVSELIRNGTLKDCGKSWVDEDAPNEVYGRDLRSTWLAEQARSKPPPREP